MSKNIDGLMVEESGRTQHNYTLQMLCILLFLVCLVSTPAFAQEASISCDAQLAKAIALTKSIYDRLIEDRVLIAGSATTFDAQIEVLDQQLRTISTQFLMMHNDTLRYQGEAARLTETVKTMAKTIQQLRAPQPAASTTKE